VAELKAADDCSSRRELPCSLVAVVWGDARLAGFARLDFRRIVAEFEAVPVMLLVKCCLDCAEVRSVALALIPRAEEPISDG